jgi:hypothetical protein
LRDEEQCLATLMRETATPPKSAKEEYSTPMSRENVELARRHIDAWNRGDVDTWVELFHPK